MLRLQLGMHGKIKPEMAFIPPTSLENNDFTWMLYDFELSLWGEYIRCLIENFVLIFISYLTETV